MGGTEAGEESPRGLIGGNEEKIFVSVRLRPLNWKEIARNDVSDWECVDENTVVYNNVNLSLTERSMYPSSYTFDRVFSSDCPTEQVYIEGAKDIALSVLSGINSSVFAYGQTSSGKTFTMSGITEYTLADIFDHIHKHKERDFLLKFSAMEIYNESVRDLLVPDNTSLRLLDDPERGTIVEKLTEETVRDWDHVIELISICEAQRQIGETSLNATSSRSHQLIRLTIESSARESLCNDNNLSTLVAAVNFVDLAGSERASQSLSAGTRLKEGCHINRSLLTLGTVIRKLSKGRNEHIPFRDSKLTRILQSSLGGNSRTAVICTMSPARSYVEQSRNTLLFASCAKEVCTNAQINVVLSDKVVIKQLQREISRLESELRLAGSTTYTKSNCDTLLREKDRQLEKMEKELKDLALQRDIALTQVRDMLKVVRDDRSSLMTVNLNHSHNMVPPISPEYSRNSPANSSIAKNYIENTDFDFPKRNSQTNSSIKNNYIQNSDVDFPKRSQSSSSCSEGDSCLSLEDIDQDQGNNGSSRDLCKDVQCIESNHDQETTRISAVTVLDNRNKAHQDSMSAPHKDNEVKLLPWPLPLPSPCWVHPSDKQSPHRLVPEVYRRLNLTKSRSCKATLMDSSMWAENTGSINDIHTHTHTANESKEDLTEKPQNSQKQQIGFNFCADVERLSRKHPKYLQVNAAFDNPVKEIESIEKESFRSVKNVGLDAIDQDDYRNNSSNWDLEFKCIQRKIVELWDACNVSIVHRTYFFLLFKGESSDSIYMEIELRRLLFLQQTFSRGGYTMQDGRTLTSSSSMKNLNRERKMLRKKLMNRLSARERESLYMNWGINLSSKNRGFQLVYKIWTEPKDMDNVFNSAVLVSKLIRFVGSDQVPKETFGLNLTHHNRRPRLSKLRFMALFQT